MKNFELLFDTIPPYPGLNIAIIEDGDADLVQSLYKFTKSLDAFLHVMHIGETQEKKENSIRIESFSLEQAKYSKFSILYDFLFLCIDMKKETNIELVFKKIYRVMKNAGELYILVDKKDDRDYAGVLEDSNYVALNSIDLNKETRVITAKKMHGWRKV